MTVTKYWNQLNIANFIKAQIPKDMTEMTFAFYFGPNELGPLQAALTDQKEAWLMSTASSRRK